jgi:hypothetical protein
LQDLGLQLERSAIQALLQADDRTLIAKLRRTPREGFKGSTTDDLVRFVVAKTFDQLDDEFETKSPSEQEEIAGRISLALRDLPPEEQERIRRAARLPDLTAETLRQTGRFASLGVGLSSLVGVAGFTAYTTLTSVVAAVTGLVGVHLSFGAYMALTSGLAGITNPLLFIPMLAGGATLMTKKANRSIRSVLFPTLVATSIMSFDETNDQRVNLEDFAARIRDIIMQIEGGSGPNAAQMVARFPSLGRPAMSVRMASHVAG